MNPKLTTHELIKIPMLELTAKHWEWDTKGPNVDLFLFASQSHGSARSSAILEQSSLPSAELLALADQFNLAAIQLRALAAEIDPGRRFEADQAVAFGVDRLEDGEVASEP